LRRDADIAATGNVERGQIERQSEQVIAQHSSDEFVDFVADLIDRPKGDFAGRIGPMARVFERVCKGCDQTDLVQDRMAVGVHDRRPGQRVCDACIGIRGDTMGVEKFGLQLVAVQILIQHRMSEPVDRVGEFFRD
jgi:hypothetical protein